MVKVITILGIDPDVFQEIEKQRGAIPRARFVNNVLRECVMPASVPRQTGTSTASPQPKGSETSYVHT